MRMDHPFILDFCQHVIFDMVFTIMFSFVWGKNILSQITVIFCVSPIQIWEPPDYDYFRIELLFQN